MYNINRRKFLGLFGCGCCSLLLPTCTTVPITERKQLSIIPEVKINQQAEAAYEAFRKKTKLITSGKQLQDIKLIGKKIEISVSSFFSNQGKEDPTKNFGWDYILVDNDKIVNAWCMPGGKIAFYSGILPVAKNEDGIAAIMGHEIAHAVARHSAERASTAMVTDLGIMALEQLVLGQRLPQAAGYVRQFGLDLPFNRSQESEADYMGLIFSSMAGYDINESYKVWERMKEDMDGSGPPEFFSTHPAPDNRIIKLKEWIPLIKVQYPPIKI